MSWNQVESLKSQLANHNSNRSIDFGKAVLFGEDFSSNIVMFTHLSDICDTIIIYKTMMTDSVDIYHQRPLIMSKQIAKYRKGNFLRLPFIICPGI